MRSSPHVCLVELQDRCARGFESPSSKGVIVISGERFSGDPCASRIAVGSMWSAIIKMRTHDYCNKHTIDDDVILCGQPTHFQRFPEHMKAPSKVKIPSGSESCH